MTKIIYKCLLDWDNAECDYDSYRKWKKLMVKKDENDKKSDIDDKWDFLLHKYIILVPECSKERWYAVYKKYVLAIYGGDKNYMRKHINVFKTETVPQKYYHHMIHNIIYFMCCFLKQINI